MDTIQNLQENGCTTLSKKKLDMSLFDLNEHDLESYLNLQGFTLDGKAPLIEMLLQSVDLLYKNQIIGREQSVSLGAKIRKVFERNLREIVYS